MQQVVERPAARHATLGGRDDEDAILDGFAFRAVPDARDHAAPAVQVVARAEPLPHDQGLALDDRPPGAIDRKNFTHRSSPVQAMSTQSAVRRKMVLKRWAVMVLTSFPELEIRLVQPFSSRIFDRRCRM
ncbi:Uncharacterised protein [Bordetella pertussis]|nr:Uncharacterised protein [Bordetella pertussis]CFP67162.1 Uncharacterised protein [Bordetella pertussis]